MKIETKTIKTILFAALIMSIAIPMTSFGIANADNSISKKDFVDQKVNDFKTITEEKRQLQKQLKEIDDSDSALKAELEVQIDDLKSQVNELKKQVKQKIKVEKSKSDKLDKAYDKIGKTFLDDASKKYTESNIIDAFVDPIGEQIIIVTSGEVSAENQDAIRKLAKGVNVIFVETEENACSNRYNCPTVRGGIRIQSRASPYYQYETSTLGFFATQTDGDVGFVMAAHGTGSGWDVKHNGVTIGTQTDSTVNGVSVDAAFIELEPGTSHWYNSIYKTSSTTYYITGTETNTSVGDFVVMSGLTSGIDAGIIVGYGWYGFIYSNIDSAHGDSGAPVLDEDNEIVGIVQGSNWVGYPYGYWTHISPYDQIKSGLNLQ